MEHRERLFFLVPAGVIVLLDQVTKLVIVRTFHQYYAELQENLSIS